MSLIFSSSSSSHSQTGARSDLSLVITSSIDPLYPAHIPTSIECKILKGVDLSHSGDFEMLYAESAGNVFFNKTTT